MASDPMFKLEHSVEDKEKSNDETPRIQLLQVRERERERGEGSCALLFFPSQCKKTRRMTSASTKY